MRSVRRLLHKRALLEPHRHGVLPRPAEVVTTTVTPGTGYGHSEIKETPRGTSEERDVISHQVTV